MRPDAAAATISAPAKGRAGLRSLQYWRCHAGTIGIIRANAEIEIASGQHLERTRSADLNISGQGGAVDINALPEPARWPSRGICVVSDDVAPRSHQTNIVKVIVLDVERDVGDVLPANDAGRFAGEKSKTGNVAISA